MFVVKIEVMSVDVYQWKNHALSFRGGTIATVIDTISSMWYDV